MDLENNLDDLPLFRPDLLTEIDIKESMVKFHPEISPKYPGEFLKMRPLRLTDYDKGFLDLLKHLTHVGDVSRKEFQARFNAMKACENSYYIVVIEDTQSSKIIGTAMLVIEQKFIHQAATRGRVEEVVVSEDYRGRQLGKLLIVVLTELSKHLGCYKVSLECKDRVLNFYKQLGYKNDGENYLLIRHKL